MATIFQRAVTASVAAASLGAIGFQAFAAETPNRKAAAPVTMAANTEYNRATFNPNAQILDGAVKFCLAPKLAPKGSVYEAVYINSKIPANRTCFDAVPVGAIVATPTANGFVKAPYMPAAQIPQIDYAGYAISGVAGGALFGALDAIFDRKTVNHYTTVAAVPPSVQVTYVPQTTYVTTYTDKTTTTTIDKSFTITKSIDTVVINKGLVKDLCGACTVTPGQNQRVVLTNGNTIYIDVTENKKGMLEFAPAKGSPVTLDQLYKEISSASASKNIDYKHDVTLTAQQALTVFANNSGGFNLTQGTHTSNVEFADGTIGSRTFTYTVDAKGNVQITSGNISQQQLNSYLKDNGYSFTKDDMKVAHQFKSAATVGERTFTLAQLNQALCSGACGSDQLKSLTVGNKATVQIAIKDGTIGSANNSGLSRTAHVTANADGTFTLDHVSATEIKSALNGTSTLASTNQHSLTLTTAQLSTYFTTGTTGVDRITHTGNTATSLSLTVAKGGNGINNQVDLLVKSNGNGTYTLSGTQADSLKALYKLDGIKPDWSKLAKGMTDWTNGSMGNNKGNNNGYLEQRAQHLVQHGFVFENGKYVKTVNKQETVTKTVKEKTVTPVTTNVAVYTTIPGKPAYSVLASTSHEIKPLNVALATVGGVLAGGIAYHVAFGGDGPTRSTFGVWGGDTGNETTLISKNTAMPGFNR